MGKGKKTNNKTHNTQVVKNNEPSGKEQQKSESVKQVVKTVENSGLLNEKSIGVPTKPPQLLTATELNFNGQTNTADVAPVALPLIVEDLTKIESIYKSVKDYKIWMAYEQIIVANNHGKLIFNKLTEDECCELIKVMILRTDSRSEIFIKIVDRYLHFGQTTYALSLKLYYYATSHNIKGFNDFNKMYENVIDKNNGFYRFIRVIYGLSNSFYNDEYYLNAYDHIMACLNQGYQIHEMLNLHVLTLPMTEAQLTGLYVKSAELEFKRFTPHVFNNREISILKSKASNGKLNIGFYSNDFYNRPSGQLALKLFYYLKQEVNIYIFCHCPFRRDDFYKFFQECSTEFIDISPRLSPEEINVLIMIIRCLILYSLCNITFIHLYV